jgi:hypothetical protein
MYDVKVVFLNLLPNTPPKDVVLDHPTPNFCQHFCQYVPLIMVQTHTRDKDARALSRTFLAKKLLSFVWVRTWV